MIRVLLVEDEPDVRNMMRVYLALGVTGSIVSAVANGREAVEVFHPSLFDVVIFDVAMPEMDGDEAARAIKRQYPEARIIFYTGNVDSLTTDVLEEIKPDAVLHKPDGIRELPSKIEHAVLRSKMVVT